MDEARKYTAQSNLVGDAARSNIAQNVPPGLALKADQLSLNELHAQLLSASP